MRVSNLLGSLLLPLAITSVAGATLVDTTNFAETSVVFAPATATSMAWAPDGSQRLFVTQKEGRISIVKNGTLLPTPFATESVYTSSECGVLGVAFDPNFVQNGYVYLFETISATTQQIVRFTANGDLGLSRTVIIGGLPTAGQNHDGGGLGFGPDGKLYWAIGDNGNGTGVSLDLTSLGSKVGRANRDGSLPAGNPFADGAGPNNDYIWARGFRNPFKLAFQPATGALWVDVVGTNFEQVFVVTQGSHAGYYPYENDQPAGFITPSVAYRTNSPETFSVTGSGAVRSGGIVTVTTTAAHGLRKGAKITLAGVANATFNGSAYVLTTPSSTSFTLAQAGANASSGGGTASTLDIGGALTGGNFWSSSALPAAYRGNYFFGDYNSGNVQRVTLAADNSVTSVDRFASDISQTVDVTAGPDGALYFLGVAGGITRVSYKAAAQGLVVSPLQVRLDEGGRAVVNVRLAMAPAATVSVNAAVTGDASLAIVAGGGLSFTASNWATPQTVMLQASTDADTLDDLASLTLSSNGLTAEAVEVRATDTGGTAPVGASVAAGKTSTFALLGALLLGIGAAALGRAKRAPSA